jgi:hypothetical protein
MNQLSVKDLIQGKIYSDMPATPDGYMNQYVIVYLLSDKGVWYKRIYDTDKERNTVRKWERLLYFRSSLSRLHLIDEGIFKRQWDKELEYNKVIL